ncbi:MAG: hypothetical protein BWY96_03111 [Spirochaetes bacterium ADurb.BinA120]|nr:MAG: hypothetical protein BWY96_03111 [Spirochaetes bacterium ADurb.BinA120]
MRDSGGDLTQGRQLFGLHKLLLRPAEMGECALELGIRFEELAVGGAKLLRTIEDLLLHLAVKGLKLLLGFFQLRDIQYNTVRDHVPIVEKAGPGDDVPPGLLSGSEYEADYGVIYREIFYGLFFFQHHAFIIVGVYLTIDKRGIGEGLSRRYAVEALHPRAQVSKTARAILSAQKLVDYPSGQIVAYGAQSLLACYKRILH